MKRVAFGGLTVSLLAATALAHHSGAMFDATKSIVKDATVKEFQWTNPHTWLNVVIMNDKGQPEEWPLEFGSLNVLSHNGWKPTTLKPGDKVTVTFRPMRDGSHAGMCTAITLADGTKMNTGGGGDGGAARAQD